MREPYVNAHSVCEFVGAARGLVGGENVLTCLPGSHLVHGGGRLLERRQCSVGGEGALLVMKGGFVWFADLFLVRIYAFMLVAARRLLCLHRRPSTPTP